MARQGLRAAGGAWRAPRSPVQGQPSAGRWCAALESARSTRGFAETLEQAGHTVHVPDLYEGRVFETLDEGAAYAEQARFDTIIERGRAAAEKLPRELVYAGSRSACSRRRCWPRPEPVRRARCCSTPVPRSPSSEACGPTESRLPSTHPPGRRPGLLALPGSMADGMISQQPQLRTQA